MDERYTSDQEGRAERLMAYLVRVCSTPKRWIPGAGGSAPRGALAAALLACMLSGSPIDGAQALPPVPRVPGPDEPLVIARGPFAPTSESFAQYRTPDWFRDAKLGIWAHWGPQAVPMFGDWYARHMYRQGHKQYADHLQRYGHPSKSGWKDVIPLWTAEKWDPARLMAL